jgi:anti-sigma regulatory factor (Ser/Thr protein kinase)
MSTATLHRVVVLNGNPEPVRALRHMVAKYLKDHGVADEVVRAVTLAFSEALDNAIEHGGAISSGHVDVWLRYTDRFIAVSLLDPGSDRVPLGRPVAADPDAERGRGFQLMNRMMDAVRVRSYPRGGTRVSMLRYLHR